MEIHKIIAIQLVLASTNTVMMMTNAFFVVRFSSSSSSLISGRRILQTQRPAFLSSSSSVRALRKRKPLQNKKGAVAATAIDGDSNDNTTNNKNNNTNKDDFKMKQGEKTAVTSTRMGETIKLDSSWLELPHPNYDTNNEYNHNRNRTKENYPSTSKGQLESFFEAVDARMEQNAAQGYDHRQRQHSSRGNNIEQQQQQQQQSHPQPWINLSTNQPQRQQHADTNDTKLTTINSTSTNNNNYKSIFDELPFLLSDTKNSKKSIFDMFPGKQQSNDTASNNINAFNRESFQEYKSVIQQILTNTKFTTINNSNDIEQIKAWLLRDERQIPIHLPTLIKAITATTTTTTTTSTTLDLHHQNPSSSLNGEDTQNNNTVHQSHDDEKDNDKNTTAVLTTENNSSNKVKLPKRKKSAYLKTNKESIQFHSELKEQKKLFLQSANFTTAQYDLATSALSYLGEYCAKMAISTPLEVAWEKIKEAGMTPREHYMSTFLYVVGNSGSSLLFGSSSGLGGNNYDREGTTSILDMLGIQEHIDGGRGLYSSSSSSSKVSLNSTEQKQQKEETYVVDLPAEVATFHDLLYEPTEKSISLRVKHLVANGNASAAEALLDVMQQNSNSNSEVADGNSLKLRTYLPVLRAYCDKGDCSAVLKLFMRMRNSPGVILEPENYVLVIATLAECGYFKKTSKEIDGAIEAGYSVGCGPKLLDELAAQMADDSLDITSASARRLHNAFIAAHTRNNEEAIGATSNLREIPSLAAMPVNNMAALDEELVVSRVTIDSKTGICPRTQVKLRLIMLKKQERRQFLEKLMQLAEAQYQVHKEKNKVSGTNETQASKEIIINAAKKLKAFADFLSTREGKPYTAIVDGANVAYFGQNFEQGKFNYYQIQFLVDALESKGEHPLVILPQKYARKYFHSTTSSRGKKQVMDEKELAIIRSLNETGKLYLVPAGCLDDYYWMLASVSDQARARNNENIDVSIDNEEGRWPGTRPMLLSNDQMRDHRMELLDPRLFRRWTSSHIVNYNFTAFVNEECVDREIGFSAPDFFSNEIQGNPSEGGTMAWHFPVSDWDEDERFCIRLPSEDPNGPL